MEYYSKNINTIKTSTGHTSGLLVYYGTIRIWNVFTGITIKTSTGHDNGSS